jgi:transcriptional regulator with XRE-family HTH domain
MSIPKIRIQFALNLRKERLKAKLTQERMAELIDVSTRYYQMLESKNPTAIKIDGIEKIAKALKISPSKLFNFD